MAPVNLPSERQTEKRPAHISSRRSSAKSKPTTSRKRLEQEPHIITSKVRSTHALPEPGPDMEQLKESQMLQEKARQELEFENDQVQNQSRITHESEEINDNTFTQNESVQIRIGGEDIDINGLPAPHLSMVNTCSDETDVTAAKAGNSHLNVHI